jgi:hypothetical protein
MFRNLIVKKQSSNLDEEDIQVSDDDVERHLLEEPNIIIADEAHKMKNTEAGISKVASRFKSARRIALTGSPLANNLDEYFAMVNWIAPGYLGTKEQFRCKYAIPISEGLWNDSDITDRRTSLRKLHVLKKNLDPKVSRADISAIASDLPPKTEFFITVPLTNRQTKAYDMYVSSILGGDQARVSGNARLWDWLAILSLLCNHPSTFMNKLDERLYDRGNKTSRAKKKKVLTTDDVEEVGLPPDIEMADAGLSQQLIDSLRELFEGLDESGQLDDPEYSNRTLIVCDIIKFAVAAGDKVLLFSHSIPTLNYLEVMISLLGLSTRRLDGTTTMIKRQEVVKNFNKDTSTCNVFLVSTRAGGLGLNLQGANRVIVFDYGFNPVWEEQAVGRAYRLGQNKPVFVYRLRAGGTFEELIYNKAVFKTQLSARVVDKKNPMRQASRKATDYLFPVKPLPPQDLSPYHNKDPAVLDKILQTSCSIRDIILTETFQKEEDESLTPEEVQQANEELKDEQEKRRDPEAYQRRQAAHQAALLNNRNYSLSTPVVESILPLGLDFALRKIPPVQPSNSSSTNPLTAVGTPMMGPRAETQQVQTGGSQIARPPGRGSWDPRARPPPQDLQNQLQQSLGAPPARDMASTSYPSPTAVVIPKDRHEAPQPSASLGQQVDGNTGGTDSKKAALVDGCKSQ